MWLLVLSVCVVSPNLISGECTVESRQCDFPYQIDGEDIYSCVEGDQLVDSAHYCTSQIEDKYITGECNSACFTEDGSPEIFNSSIGDDVMAFFCKTKPSPCVFPFIWEGREYRECTTDGESPFPWCALAVGEDGSLVERRWGKCDMSTCDPVSATSSEVENTAKSLTISFSEYLGNLVFDQAGPDADLEVAGSLEGLPEDVDLELVVVDGDCQQPLEDNIDSIVSVQDLTGPEVLASTPALSLFPGDKLVIGRSALVKIKEGPLLTESGGLQLGEVLACTPIQEATGLSLTVLIILVILGSVLAILVLLLIICICCWCCKRTSRRNREKKVDSLVDSIDDSMGNGSTKIPLYDELSIPFIDASLPPTPKMGRSTDQLAILLGRGSKTSLNMNP